MVIKTTVFPLRVSFKKKEPWELAVEIENEDADNKKVSLRIELPMEATFSTVGSSTIFEKRFDSFRGMDKAAVKMPVYISNRASEGNYYGKVAVAEHFHDYDYVQKKFAKEIPFRIVP